MSYLVDFKKIPRVREAVRKYLVLETNPEIVIISVVPKWIKRHKTPDEVIQLLIEHFTLGKGDRIHFKVVNADRHFGFIYSKYSIFLIADLELDERFPVGKRVEESLNEIINMGGKVFDLREPED